MMGKRSKLIETVLDNLAHIYFFIESLEAEELNASDKAQLISIRNYAIGIVNEINKLLGKINGLR